MTKLEQLKAAFEGSTECKWETSALMAESGPCEWTVCVEGGGDMLADLTDCPDEQANACYIALAHNAMPGLLDAAGLAKQIAAQDPITFSDDAPVEYRQLADMINAYQAAARQLLEKLQ